MSMSHLLWHRTTVTAALLVLLLGMAEFYQRARTDHDSAQQNNTSIQNRPVVVALPSYTEQTKQVLLEQFNKYDKQQRIRAEAEQQNQAETIDAQQSEMLSDAEIAAQNGELLSVATESGKLYLRGVVRSAAAQSREGIRTDNYALVQQVQHQDKNATSIVRLSKGDVLDGFTVTQLNLNSITLERGAQKIELLMYKTTQQEQ